MKKLLFVFMLFPVILFGQVGEYITNASKVDSIRTATFIVSDSIPQFRVLSVKDLPIIDITNGRWIHNFASKKEYGTLYLTDRIGQYIKECYADSTYVEYWKPADYSPYQSTDDNGNTMQLSIYISPTRVKEYKHKEPTFIGFYEWLVKQTK